MPVAYIEQQRDDTHMRTHQAGTSVLAALVFVAIFVLFISGYKVVSQGAPGQAAAVASARTATVHSCTPGELYTVHMESGQGSVQSLKCFIPDPGNPSQMIPGPDSSRSECAHGEQGKCAVRYCPPDSYVTESGTCFVVASCEPGDTSNGCLKSTIQNASQSVQAANIIAAQLLADKGETDASSLSTNGPIALADNLSESGRVAVADVIEETADAADENNLDSSELRSIARSINDGKPAPSVGEPIAQISCQPKVAESGMKIGIAFGCANSLTSSGGGFSTGGRLWGATDDNLAQNLPNGTMIYALTCANGAHTATASCSVSVVKPFMLLTSARTGSDVSFAWVTRGMDVCELSAPTNTEMSAQFGNPIPQSGALSVAAPTKDTDITLTCTSVSGAVKQVTTLLKAN